MKHCYYFKCAMNVSSSIEQAAAQPLFLCPVCSRKLQRALNFNLVTWYAALAQSCRQVENEIKRAIRVDRSEEMRLQDQTSDGVSAVGYRLQDSDQSNYGSRPAAPGQSRQDSRNSLPQNLTQDSNSCQSPPTQAPISLFSAPAPYLQYLEQAIHWIDRANLSIVRHFKP